MQKVYLRKNKTLDYPSRDNAKILHFSLQDALPSGHSLALNMAFGTLSYPVCENSSTPRLLRQEQFTHTELSVLKPMLELFRYYCPCEVLSPRFEAAG